MVRLKLSFHLDTENNMNEEDNWEHLKKIITLKAKEIDEEKKAQEEAHKHFVSVEFSHMLVEDGVASTFGKLSKEAQRDIRAMITLHGNNLL